MKKSKKSKTWHLVHYIENCESKNKKFNSLSNLSKFVKQFNKNNPTYADGYWIDFIVTHIEGKLYEEGSDL